MSNSLQPDSCWPGYVGFITQCLMQVEDLFVEGGGVARVFGPRGKEWSWQPWFFSWKFPNVSPNTYLNHFQKWKEKKERKKEKKKKVPSSFSSYIYAFSVFFLRFMLYTQSWTNSNFSLTKMCQMVHLLFSISCQINFSAPLKWHMGQVPPLAP